MINLIVSGKVGRDAKIVNNSCVFSLATTKRGYKTNDGTEIPDKTIWFSVFANKNLEPYIKSGDSITVYANDINSNIYENKVNLSINARELEFMGKSSSNEQHSQPTTEQNKEVSDLQKHMDAPDETDDLPF